MRLIPQTAALVLAALLYGCEDAAPVAPVLPEAPTELLEAGTISMLPGRGAASFVGRWAADVSECAAASGVRRPIEISVTRFEGPGSSCSIAAVDEVADGYVATLACLAEGEARAERVRFQVTGDVMRLHYLDRAGEPVTLNKCTTLEETSTTTPTALP